MARSVVADPVEIATRFHALSDPTRIEVVELLREGERCVCELTDTLGAAQSRLSFHLKVLKEAGLIIDRREGRWVYYTLDVTALDELETYLSDLRSNHGRVSKRANACCE